MKIKILLLIMTVALFLFSCTKRQPEEVDYAPNSPWNPYPPDSSTNIDHTTLDVTLKWTASDPNSGDVLTYAIYFDTLNPPLTSIATGLSSSSYFMTGLSYNTTYYWKLYITDDKGVITCGPIWRFTTLPHANSAPNVPTYLYPADNAAWEYPTLSLNWDCTDPEESSDTLYYDLYLGVTTEPPITLFKDTIANHREFTGLNYTTTYYWKVVVRDNHYAYTSGPVNSFTTRDCPWFYKRELPSPRYDFGTAVVNGRIYVIGGSEGLNSLAEVLEYDPLLDTWTRKADMPTARSGLAVAVWDNKIYAIGGRVHDAIYNNNEVYDPLLDTWSSRTPMPIVKDCFTGAPIPNDDITSAHAIKGRIYTVGPIMEYTISTDDWWDTTYYYTINDSLNVDSIIGIDTFNTPVKSYLPNNNLYHCSAVYNNLIYVMGGSDSYAHLLSGVMIYHPGTNSWAMASDMIGPANMSAATVANGFLYVIGGYDGTYSKRVRKYDPISDTWAIRSDLQKERSFLGAAFVGGFIYAIGGTSPIPLSTVEEYQLDLDPKNTSR